MRHPGPPSVARPWRRLLPWLAAACIPLGHAPASGAPPQVQAVAGSIGGAGNSDIAAGCTTYGPQKQLLDFFGSGQGIPIPAGGIAACGYVAQQADNTSPVSATASASVGPVILGNPGFAGYYTGGASAEAQYSGLRAAAQGSFSAGLPGSPTALINSASAAFFSDVLTVTSPLVQLASAGSIGYRFKLDGSLTAAGTPMSYYFGETLADLAFQHAGGPVYGAAHVYTRRGEIGTATSGGVAIAGWTGSTGAVSGSGIVSTLDLVPAFPIVFGQAWDFTLGLAVNAIGEASASFLSTAQLVGLDVFDAAGVRLDTFTLSAASGTRYITDVPPPVPVPEPGSWLLLLAGLGAIGWLRLRPSSRPLRAAR